MLSCGYVIYIEFRSMSCTVEYQLPRLTTFTVSRQLKNKDRKKYKAIEIVCKILM